MTTILAIDPGQAGGIAIADDDGIDCWPMPATHRDVWDLLQTQMAASSDVVQWHAYIEDVHAMPQQGVSSTFKFGQSYGFLLGLLVASRVAFTRVRPQAWQKALGIVAGKISGGADPRDRARRQRVHKNRLKMRAQELYPDLKITLKTADSVLIAHYGQQVQAIQKGVA